MSRPSIPAPPPRLSHAPPRRTCPPAEWEPHRGCVSAWPAHRYAWGEHLDAAQREFVAFVRAFATHAGEPLHLLCPGGRLPDPLADLGAAVQPIDLPYGDVWLRDTAPVWLTRERAVRFRFNGWGNKYRYPKDEQLADTLATALETACAEVPLIAEGGALEGDGEGTLLTTRSCLLNPNRNPDTELSAVEAHLRRALGAERIIWLDEGLVGDHTDGHIDNLARFVAPGAVVCATADSPASDDPNARVLSQVATCLGKETDARGRSLRVHALPTPGPRFDAQGMPMPASYLNFYIANHAVFVPQYGAPGDRRALEVLHALFPGRRVLGVRSGALLTGGGSLHCMTQQLPA